MTSPLNLALVLGSAREGRMCDRVAAWAAEEIRGHGGFSLDILDPITLDLPFRPGRRDAPAVQALKRRIDAADAFVIVTPEYNHGYPAALKGLIDSAYAEWQAKPVAFVSYGGGSGGIRAVEQLRLVFAELHTATIRDTVTITDIWDRFDAAGALKEPERPERAMAVMLKRLSWWGEALRAARSADAYLEDAA